MHLTWPLGQEEKEKKEEEEEEDKSLDMDAWPGVVNNGWEAKTSRVLFEVDQAWQAQPSIRSVHPA